MTDFDKVLNEVEEIRKRGDTLKRAQDNYTLRKAKSNLFFDDNARIDFLASERFPNDPYGSEKYVNIDGDLYYENEFGEKLYGGKKYSLEFPNNEAVGAFSNYVVPNLVPATTFVADVGGGMYGAKKGFQQGLRLQQGVSHPFAKLAVITGATMAGGFGGNYLIGGIARTGREATIDQFYSLPPEEIAAAHNDLLISSTFSLIPFGQGTKGTSKIMSIFHDRPDALRYLVELRGSTDDTIREAKQLGFDLTPAQADTIGSRAADIQYFLSRQPDARAITQFYDTQASQIAEAITTYADNIASQSGKIGDVNTRMVETTKRTMDELTRKRKQRATRLYNILKEAPNGVKVQNIDSIIDLIDSKIAGEVLDESGKLIRRIEPSEPTIKNLKQFKEMFYKGGSENGVLIDDLMELDARRTSQMKALAFKLQSEGTGDAGMIYGIMDDMTALMDESAPLYRQARRVYDPNKPALQLAEKSALGRFSKIMTDKQTANAMKELFNPNVSIQSLRNSRRILQTADPDLFQDIKQQFLMDQYDKFFKAEALQKGMPALQKHFQGNKIKAMMQEMLSPEEFDNFYKMNDLMGMAFRIPVGGSPTQPLTEMASELASEALSSNMKAVQSALALINLSGRVLTGQFGDEVVRKIAKDQQHGYLDLLTKQLLSDPDAAKNLDDVYNFFNTNEFIIKQTGARGVVEGIDQMTEPSVQPYTGKKQESYDELIKQIEEVTPSQSQITIEPETTSDLSPVESVSPVILPNEKDREIAMRQMGGIGSLV